MTEKMYENDHGLFGGKLVYLMEPVGLDKPPTMGSPWRSTAGPISQVARAVNMAIKTVDFARWTPGQAL
jgi:hypothetical protein